jgi:UDP-glucose 4-epimerase
MNILVTGAAGYIGSVVCEMLQNAGHSLFLVDDLRAGKQEALPQAGSFYKADFGDAALLDDIFSLHTINLVIHLAASANVPDSVSDPLPYYENNVSSTISLLKKMKQYGVKKIIFSSTAAVYGEPIFSPITEDHSTCPVNPYGFSKLFDEQIMRDCAKAYDIHYVFFRYFCAAGATRLNGESRIYESHLIPLVIDQALGKRETVHVYGNDFNTKDGSGVRDYIHVADIARAHINAIEFFDIAHGHVLNLGTGSGYSVFEVIRETEKVTGKKIEFTIGARRPGDPASLIASFEKARQMISWEPEFSLGDIILSAYEWRKAPRY